jgi:hypothetical protein
MPIKPPPLRGWEDSYTYKIGCLVIKAEYITCSTHKTQIIPFKHITVITLKLFHSKLKSLTGEMQIYIATHYISKLEKFTGI